MKSNKSMEEIKSAEERHIRVVAVNFACLRTGAVLEVQNNQVCRAQGMEGPCRTFLVINLGRSSVEAFPSGAELLERP
jgi:hypothetical protein